MRATPSSCSDRVAQVPPLITPLEALELGELTDHAEIEEAAASLGMSKGLTLRKIVLPQAMRIIIPPTGNETISMLKTTSLVSTIGWVELFQATQNISSTNYQVVPLLVVASLWYLFFTSVMTIGQFYVERYYSRGARRTLPPTPLQRVRATLFRSSRRPRRGIA